MPSDDQFFLAGIDKVKQRSNYVFVLLPFKHSLVYEAIILPAAEKHGLDCQKADDIFGTGAIMSKIARGLKEASLVVADLTDRNPNVFYELGLAHAFGKRVILITHSEDDIPSDLRGFEYHRADLNSTSGIEKFKETIDRIFSQSRRTATKSYRDGQMWDIHASKGNEELIESSFLDLPNGGVSFWVYINQYTIDTPKERYFLAHAGNKGERKEVEIGEVNELGENISKKTSKYVNVFAVRRWGKSSQKPTGSYSFWCSDGDGNALWLISSDELNVGWHMFTVAWSRGDDTIKFFIDKKHIKTTPFSIWPEQLEAKCVIGAWPTRSPNSYVNSRIGTINVLSSTVSYETIVNLYNSGLAKLNDG